VTVTTRRGEMTAPALVVRSIRPDTIFIPYHYGHRMAVNRLTNPATDPGVKIPEYKVCAATVEKIGLPEPSLNGAKENFTPKSNPAMFPYAVGEVRSGR
jgi:assimilatory nitrate reductase catalytic subunit